MILLHHVVERRALAEGDRGAMGCLVTLADRCRGGTPSEGARLWPAVATERLGQTAWRGLLVALLRQETIPGLALRIYRTGEIPPLALHLARRLLQAPAAPAVPCAARQRLCEEGTLRDAPPGAGRVLHLHPPFFHACLAMAGAQRIRHRPPHPHAHDLLGELGPLHTERHRLAPSCITVGHRGRSYGTSPQMKMCDKTYLSAGLRYTTGIYKATLFLRWHRCAGDTDPKRAGADDFIAEQLS